MPSPLRFIASPDLVATPKALRMFRYDLLDETQNKLDYILSLTVKNLLERCLHILVFKSDAPGAPRQWWFGGGTDLTPSYIFEEDVKHFHLIVSIDGNIMLRLKRAVGCFFACFRNNDNHRCRTHLTANSYSSTDVLVSRNSYSSVFRAQEKEDCAINCSDVLEFQGDDLGLKDEAYTSELQLKVDHLLEKNAKLKRQQQKACIFIFIHKYTHFSY
ncbi:hypothetical protein Ahy_B01g053023 [Arachis hypogaea]|uniref:coproporphyrinogen oxidase n=2 Tax=Arachis hypogaea TaxID=3818 RepID=A0A445AR07_ARAHY|nr:hypothetical protein Ahy_B01g053023 [Arachis hypogaea]